MQRANGGQYRCMVTAGIVLDKLPTLWYPIESEMYVTCDSVDVMLNVECDDDDDDDETFLDIFMNSCLPPPSRTYTMGGSVT